MKNTIKGIAQDTRISAWSVQDDSYSGAMLAHHPESGFVFLWAHSESVTGSNFPASRIAVKHKMLVASAHTAGNYIHRETIADISVYDDRTGAITVNYGIVGFRNAVARWIRDYEAPVAIEYRNYLRQWELAERVNGLENAKERLETLRTDYGHSEYRINRRRR